MHCQYRQRRKSNWKKSPRISGLLVAIAQQEFEVGEPQLALQAVRLLQDSGFIECTYTFVVEW